MIYDKFAGIVERHMPKLIPTAQDAVIVEFNHDIREFKLNCDDLKHNLEFGVLPGRITCVEDVASSIFLWAKDSNKIGFDHRYSFIDILPTNLDAKNYQNSDTTDIKIDNTFGNDSYVITFGEIDKIRFKEDINKGYIADIFVDQIVVADKKRGILSSLNKNDISKFSNEMLGSAGINVVTAIEELSLINSKKRFLVERSPIKKRSRKGIKIERSDTKPVLISLSSIETVNLIQKKDYDDETFKAVASHYRRAHLRALRDKRYARDEFGNIKTIKINASWIGEDEIKKGSIRYKVKL